MSGSFKKKLTSLLETCKTKKYGFFGEGEASFYEGKIAGLESALELLEECEKEDKELSQFVSELADSFEGKKSN